MQNYKLCIHSEEQHTVFYLFLGEFAKPELQPGAQNM